MMYGYKCLKCGSVQYCENPKREEDPCIYCGHKESELIVGEREICLRAIRKWGADAQITIVFEEMAELQKELCKSLRGNGSTDNIAEEIADVEIMLAQMKILFHVGMLVEENKQCKLLRLLERIEA